MAGVDDDPTEMLRQLQHEKQRMQERQQALEAAYEESHETVIQQETLITKLEVGPAAGAHLPAAAGGVGCPALAPGA